MDIIKTPEEFMVMIVGIEDINYDALDSKMRIFNNLKKKYADFVKYHRKNSPEHIQRSVAFITDFYISVIDERIRLIKNRK